MPSSSAFLPASTVLGLAVSRQAEAEEADGDAKYRTGATAKIHARLDKASDDTPAKTPCQHGAKREQDNDGHDDEHLEDAISRVAVGTVVVRCVPMMEVSPKRGLPSFAFSRQELLIPFAPPAASPRTPEGAV